MAESTNRITHNRAKGRTTNEKPRRRTTRRPRATPKPAPRKQKTPPAKAARKPQPEPDGGATPGDAQPGESEKHGLDRLMDEVDKMLDENSPTIAQTMGDQLALGNTNVAKFVFSLDERKKRSSDEGSDQFLTSSILDISSQPEFQEPAEDGRQKAREQRGVITETEHAVV